MVRNLLGRLNNRNADDLQRIAQWWLVPLPAGDRGNQIGTLYRAMTDLRQIRAVWERLDPNARAIVRDLATSESGPLSIADIARITDLSESTTRDAAIRLFRAGILSREGDNQELPIGAVPKLFLPRELGQHFRRVQDEIDAGDLSTSSMRVLVETLDDTEIEEAARIWGLTVIPGFRRRADLIGQVLRQVGSRERIAQVAGSRGREATALWTAVRAAADDGPVRLDEALGRAGLARSDAADVHVLRALSELEAALLVFHTYRRDGSRWLFVPREIVAPEDVAATLPLKPLQPLEEGSVPEPEPRHPHALAWDLLTVLREISEHDPPVWTPGEPLSRSWQRRINRRLWFAGEETPPTGYLGFLLHVAFGVGVIVPAQSAGLERGALRPEVTPRVREWRRLSFAEQTEALKGVWLASEGWVEGRERGEIEVWGADWRGMRHKLVTALERIDPAQWVTLDDLALRLAEQDPTLLGTTFTAASARSSPGDADGRTAAIAQVVGVELETATQWFRLVDLSVVAGKARAVRIVPPPSSDDGPAAGPAMTVSEEGLIALQAASPLHVWSLSAFSDAEGVRPVAVYQLRPGSVSRALAAGFDADQIVTYLTRQTGATLPERLAATLREWSAGYRRIRLRRAIVLHPDADEMRAGLRDILAAAGLEIVGDADAGPLIVLLPATHDGSHAERDLLATLRANGYAGHWEIAPTSS